MSGAEKINVTVTEIVPVNELVTRFKFERSDGERVGYLDDHRLLRIKYHG